MIEQMQDYRVIRMDTLRVYSCPESIAYVLNITVKDVWFNCDGWTKTVGNNVKLKWYSFYLEETPEEQAAKPNIVETLLVHRTKPSLRDQLRAQNKSVGNYLRRFKYLYKFIEKLIEEDTKDRLSKWVPIRKVSDALFYVAVEYFDIDPEDQNQITAFSSVALSRNISARSDYYKKYFGIEHCRKYCREYGNYMFHIKRSEKNEIIPYQTAKELGLFNLLIDRESVYYGGPTSHSKPVIRLQDKAVFSSLRVASQITKIDRDVIKWCCEGDIDSINTGVLDQVFRYAKLIDDNPVFEKAKSNTQNRDYKEIRNEND